MTATRITVPAQVTGFAGDPGVLFVLSHSGGKDSQAQMIQVLDAGIPASQCLVVHASLGDIEWPGALELAQAQAEAAGIPFLVAHAFYKDGSPKTFENKVEYQFARRPDAPSFPGPRNRWCTSELKTGPIEREVRQWIKRQREYRGKRWHTVVMCTGLRAQESEDRRNAAPWSLNTDNSTRDRAWFDWLPIHSLSTLDVFQTIEAAGQEPHPAYGVVSIEGEPYASKNERLSCLFCIFASKHDIANAAKAHPQVYARFTALEARVTGVLSTRRKSLAELVAQAAL